MSRQKYESFHQELSSYLMQINSGLIYTIGIQKHVQLTFSLKHIIP